MKVFISWSKPRSQAVAEALRDWLPEVIQVVKPFTSKLDIRAGERWGRILENQLNDAVFGIICATPENQAEPWLLFEAGALSKYITRDGFVCPYVLDMKESEIKAPLGQFQSKQATEEGTWNLVQAINESLGESGLDEKRLKQSFDRCYGELKKKLDSIPPSDERAPERTADEMFDEILSTVREISRFRAQLPPQFGQGSVISIPSGPTSPSMDGPSDRPHPQKTPKQGYIKDALAYAVETKLSESGSQDDRIANYGKTAKVELAASAVQIPER